MQLATRNPELSAEYTRVIEDLDLREFWPFITNAIARRHASPNATMVGSLEQWQHGFVSELLLQLFAPQIAAGKTLAARQATREKTAAVARHLSSRLADDPDLFAELLYWQRNHAGASLDAVELLGALADLAGSPIQPHPFEAPYPGAKGAIANQRGLALRDLFIRYTGHKHWRWIESLIEAADGCPPGNIRARIEKKGNFRP